MAIRSGKGMNKEKFVCCSSIVLLAACMLLTGVAQAFPQSPIAGWVYHTLFGSVPPKQVTQQAPFTARPSLSEFRVAVQPPVRDPENTGRNSPFVPPPPVKPIKGEGNKGGDTNKTDGGVARGDKGGGGGDRDPKETLRPTLLDGSSPVAYMGVLGVSGQRYGMLRVKNGRFLNVREGDDLTDLGCTIVRVEKEAIHLLTRKGLYFVLSKNGS